jgi:hypothetical protein
MNEPRKERIDCHLSEDECLLPEWAKKLQLMLEKRIPERTRSAVEIVCYC